MDSNRRRWESVVHGTATLEATLRARQCLLVGNKKNLLCDTDTSKASLLVKETQAMPAEHPSSDLLIRYTVKIILINPRTC